MQDRALRRRQTPVPGEQHVAQQHRPDERRLQGRRRLLRRTLAVDETYLVPIDAVGVSVKTLRLETPQNNQSAGVDMAADYTLDTQLNALRVQSGGTPT
ncbi:MAG: hypothetical protein ABEH83_07875 [Halobacterium sp.]